jgi:dTDP-4-dehydrorhamnose reductase
VTALDRASLDLGCVRSIDDALVILDYDYIFILGSLTGVDYCESHVNEAFAVNDSGPGRIAEISAMKSVHVTYISSDMVFSGSKIERYLEADPAEPISVYGASKLEGEARVLRASEGNLVARVSWVYGPGRPAFPEWIFDQACSESNLTLPGDKICCPTYTLDLIEWLAVLVLAYPVDPRQGGATSVIPLHAPGGIRASFASRRRVRQVPRWWQGKSKASPSILLLHLWRIDRLTAL